MRPFDLLMPKTVDEALALLADPGGRPIAGGSDLIPLMQADKSRPERVIDLSRLSVLRDIRQDGDGYVRVGALTTHAQLEASALLWERATTLAQAASMGGADLGELLRTLAGPKAEPAGDVPEHAADRLLGHSRTFLKIQDGCDASCAYCVVPLARGPGRSLPAKEAIDRAVRAERDGAR